MAATKKFPGQTKLNATLVNFKNADIYDIAFKDNDGSFVFTQGDGIIKYPTDVNGNSTMSEGAKIEFTLNGDKYYSLSPSGNKPISKAEADKIESAILATATANTLVTAANSAVKSETIKKTNIKKIGYIVAGSLLFIGAISLLWYRAQAKACASSN